MRLWVAARVTRAHGLSGGMEQHTDALVRGLARLGHEVTLATTSHPHGLAEEEREGVTTLYLPDSSWRSYRRRWWEKSYAELRRRHTSRSVDAVLSVSAGALGYLSRARRELGLPALVLLHGSARGELLTAWRGARNARGAYRLGRAGVRAARMLALWRRAAPAVGRWAAVSATVAADAARELGITPGLISVVPSGVDTETFRPDPEARRATRARHALPPDAIVALVVGRLEPEKGVHVALDAVASAADTRLVVAGDGRAARSLARRAESRGLSQRILFLGHVDRAELPDLYAASDVFVLPSLCHEGLPLAVLEAQASGLPVVASDAGGTADAVAAETALVVPRGDAAALTQALLQLGSDGDLRARMAAAARAEAEARFDEARMVVEFERLLRNMVAAWA